MSKLKVPLFLGVALLAIAYLVFRGVSRNDIYMSSLDQWDPQRATRDSVRVVGFVEEGSIKEKQGELVTSFVLKSPNGKVHVPVQYHGVTPDLFRDGANVVVAGRLGTDGVFAATDLMTKCPSKYEGVMKPAPEATSDAAPGPAVAVAAQAPVTPGR